MPLLINNDFINSCAKNDASYLLLALAVFGLTMIIYSLRTYFDNNRKIAFPGGNNAAGSVALGPKHVSKMPGHVVASLEQPLCANFT